VRLIFILFILLITSSSFAQTGKFYGLFPGSDFNKVSLIRLDLRHHKIDTIKINDKYRYNWTPILPGDPKSFIVYLNLLDSADHEKLVGVNVRTGNIICDIPCDYFGGGLSIHYDHDLKKFIRPMQDGIYLLDTTEPVNPIKIIDLKYFFSYSSSYDPVSKVLILKTADTPSALQASTLWLLDIQNKKVLRKIKCGPFDYDYLQYDRNGKRFYFFSRDSQGDEWITTTDSALLNPKRLLRVADSTGLKHIGDAGSFFDMAYQRYFFVSWHYPGSPYLVAYDVSQNALVDSIQVSVWMNNLIYFPDSTKKVIPDAPLDNSVLVYPNPFTNRINFRCKNPIGKIEIYDILGRRIETFNPTCDFIMTPNWRPGMYVALVTVGDKVIPVKIEKVAH
jgi:hypothetical protein